MTDQRTKPTWTRCPECKWRIWNDAIDIDAHRRKCPANFERTIRNMTRTMETFLERLQAVEGREVVVPEINVNDEVADWTEPEQTSQYVDDITPPATISEPAAGEPLEHPTDADGYFSGPLAIDRDDITTTSRGFMQ